ncbi:MAG: hypothetical protein ABJJ53_09115 [Sulfitobacter sp.]
MAGTASLKTTYAASEPFFKTPKPPRIGPPWIGAIEQRGCDLAPLAAGLWVMLALLARLKLNTPVRLGVLAFIIGVVSWYSLGQLSIVASLAALCAPPPFLVPKKV